MEFFFVQPGLNPRFGAQFLVQLVRFVRQVCCWMNGRGGVLTGEAVLKGRRGEGGKT